MSAVTLTAAELARLAQLRAELAGGERPFAWDRVVPEHRRPKWSSVPKQQRRKRTRLS